MGSHVFICYAREDEQFVRKLAANLKEHRVPIWFDRWDIPLGADWDQSIDNAIYDCAKFLIVLSPAAVESKEVRGELRTALDENKPIVPVIHRPCRIPRQLRTVQYVDFTSRGPEDAAALEQVVRTLGGTKPAPTPPKVSQQTQEEEAQPQEPPSAGKTRHSTPWVAGVVGVLAVVIR